MKEKEKLSKKERKRKNKISTNKGITLVALVVTIVILLILAGITIMYVMGDNSVFNKASQAKEQTEIASIKEEIQTEILGRQAENQGNISDDNLEKILLTYGKLSNEEKLIDKTLNTTKGNHKIKVSDIFNGTTVKDLPKEPTLKTVANNPDINGFDKTKTYYVVWNENKEKTAYNLDEKKISENIAPDNWYDYTAGTNYWANIKTTGGGNECYWVWIPRYAYKVPTKGGTAETIEIAFLKDTGSTIDDVIDETKKQTIEAAGGFKTTSTVGNWVIHPAFTNEGNGGFGELTGIWVAKFEASSSNVSETTVTSDLTTTGGGDVTNLKVRVKPNVTSWRGITANNIFTVCRNLTTSGNSLEGATRIDSHMMKNTEWGAVAYLSRSIYGKNGEVWNNPYYNHTTNYSPITGLCSNETDGKDKAYTGADITKTYKYNEKGGENASTTGNVYGVYDMAGGAWEYVAGILSNNKKHGNNTEKNNYYDFSNSNTYPNRYFDWYAGTSSDRNTNYNANTEKYGDAVYETSSSGDSDTGSWDSGYSKFPYSSYPVFIRGGRAGTSSYTGVFAFYYGEGEAYIGSSFRPVVICSQS